MDTVALKRSMSNLSYNQNSMMGRRSFPSYENVAPIIHGGLLQPPHPFSSSCNPSLFNHHMQQHLLHQQPPLLPLPVSKPLHQSLPYRTRSQPLTPKKPKSKPELPKKMNNMNRLGPETKELPKDITKVMSSSSSVGVGRNMDNFSSSIFILAPPPSSLPLPRFSMKSAKGFKAGVGVDAGATDNLCRLMRLR